MKKKRIIIASISCTILAVCICVIILFLLKEKKPTKYLIDILIRNSEMIDIDYIQMGVMLSEEEKIINTVKGELAKKEEIHFTISYSPDTIFFLKGMSGNKEIEKCTFDMKDYSKEYEPQKKYFHIENYKIYED